MGLPERNNNGIECIIPTRDRKENNCLKKKRKCLKLIFKVEMFALNCSFNRLSFFKTIIFFSVSSRDKSVGGKESW